MKQHNYIKSNKSYSFLFYYKLLKVLIFGLRPLVAQSIEVFDEQLVKILVTNIMTIHHIINDYNLSLGAQRLAIDLHKGGLQAGLSSKLLGLSNDSNYNIKKSRSFKYKSVYNLFIPF